jgi:hypothetical protein
MKVKRYKKGSEIRAVITDKTIPGEAIVLHDGDIAYRDSLGIYHTVRVRGMEIIVPDKITYSAKPLLILAHYIAIGLSNKP